MLNFLLNLLPTIAGILLGICYIPQLIKTAKTKNVESMSTAFWVILNIALTFLAINAYVVFATSKVWGYAVTETFNEGLALVQLIMVLKYRKKVELETPANDPTLDTTPLPDVEPTPTTQTEQPVLTTEGTDSPTPEVEKLTDPKN